MTGSVIWFHNAKGWGFIKPAEGPDIFVHYSAIHGDGFKHLSQGDQVEFEIVNQPKGPVAANVVVTERCTSARRQVGRA